MPEIFPVTAHTKHVGPGSTFVAIKGAKEDGINYISQAIELGAYEIVVAEDAQIPDNVQELINSNNIMVTRSSNTRVCLALMSARACGFPAQKLKIIGVTGTKGKTTTCYLLEHILATAGYKTALSTTVTSKILDSEFKSPLTTPQPDYLQVFLKLCVSQGVELVVMEVSAQALSLHRLEGITFDGIIWTNFSQEHAEFYPTIDQYFKAKCDIFKKLKSGSWAYINADDPFIEQCKNHSDSIKTYGFISHAAYSKAEYLGNQNKQVSFSLDKHQYSCKSLMGSFNSYNCLAAASMALQLGVPCHDVAHALTLFQKVPGRLERYTLPNGALGIIDYAHNPSSYTAVLSLLAQSTDHLIVVFAAGGDRDKTKRPIMGEIAAQYGSVLILTSDNPRSENPATIADDVERGIPAESLNKVVRELDREKAIKKAYELSRSGSIIVLLGKGPDEYQIIGGNTLPFSEKSILLSLR